MKTGCRFASLTLLVLIAALPPARAAGERHATILNPNRFYIYPQYPLGEYGITEHRFFSVGPDFPPSLKQSKLLYIAQTFPVEQIFSKPEYSKAVDEHLKAGGAIWFESYIFSQPAMLSWLKEHSINLPPQDTSNQGITRGAPAADLNHPILKSPYDVVGKYKGKGNFCWRNWGEDFIAPLRVDGDPLGATMLIRENILGRGKVIFNSTWALSTTDYAGNGFWGEGQKVLMNILSWCYGERISETDVVPLFKRFNTAEKLAVWGKNPYLPLADCPPDAPEKQKLLSISLKACVNEDVSALFCLTASSASGPIDVAIQKAALKNSSGGELPAEKITVHELQFFHDFSGRWIYDPMPKTDKITVPPGETRQVWITVNTAGAKPGTYAGKLVLDVSGAGRREVPVSLVVWPIELPAKNPLSFCAWDYVPNEGRSQYIGGWENWKNYQEDLLSHGVNVFPVMSFNHPYVKCDKEGNITAPLDYKLFDQEFYIREKGYIYLVSTPRVFGKPADMEYMSPAYERMLRAWVKEIIAHLKSLGLDYDQFAFYPWDELASSADVPNAAREYAIIKETDPNAKIFLTVGGSGMAHFDRLKPVAPYVDIWCPHIFFNRYFAMGDPSRKTILDFMGEKGARVWSYENTGRWKTKDDVYGSFRLKPIGAYRAGVKGYGFWAYNVWKGNPWEVFDENGNVKQGVGTESLAIVYSGPEPVTTPRWEGLREGMNDVKYFEVLKAEIAATRARGAPPETIAAAEQMIELALKEITEKFEDPEVIFAWREKIALAILDLRDAGRKSRWHKAAKAIRGLIQTGGEK